MCIWCLSLISFSFLFVLCCFDGVGEDKVQSVAYLGYKDMTLVLEADISSTTEPN
jgi:hypothetical protein